MDKLGTRNLMIGRRIFTLVGAALVLRGAFLPFLGMPIFHDETFLDLSVEGGGIVMGLAVLSLGCILFRRFGFLYLTGLSILGLVIYTIYQVNTQKAGYISDFSKAMEGSPLKGLGISFVKSVDFSHGAAYMLAGALILICVPLLGSRLTRRRGARAQSQ